MMLTYTRHFFSSIGVRAFAVTLVAALLPALLSPPAASAPRVAGTGSPPDSRLAQTAGADHLEGTLGEYLEDLSDESGITLQASGSLTGRALLALHARKSIHQLQSALAANWQGSWRSSTKTVPDYTLVRSQTDEEAREGAKRAVERAGRARMLRRWNEVRGMASLPPEELKQLAPSNPMAKCLLHPRGAAMARLAFQMPQPLLSALWTSGRARIPVASLPGSLQESARQGLGNGRVAWTQPNGSILEAGGDVRKDGVVTLNLGGTPDAPTVWIGLKSGGRGIVTNLLQVVAGTREPPQARRQGLAKSRYAREPQLQGKITLREPASRKHLEPGERPPGARPLAVFLKELAKQTEIPILAECEYRPKDGVWLRGQSWLGEDIVGRPLYEALDLLCADFEYEWRYADGFLLLRPRLWYLEPSQRGYAGPAQ